MIEILTSSHSTADLNLTSVLSVVAGFESIIGCASRCCKPGTDTALDVTGISIGLCVCTDLIEIHTLDIFVVLSGSSSVT